MATIFWDYQGVLLVNSLTHGTTVNAASYCAALDRFREAIRHKQRGLFTTMRPIAARKCPTAYSQNCARFVTAFPVRGIGLPSLQSRPHTKRLPSLW